MKKELFYISLACVLTATTAAHAERMRDMSLSEEESLRQPSVTYNQPSPFGNSSPPVEQAPVTNAFSNNSSYSGNSRNSMDSYGSAYGANNVYGSSTGYPAAGGYPAAATGALPLPAGRGSTRLPPVSRGNNSGYAAAANLAVVSVDSICSSLVQTASGGVGGVGRSNSSTCEQDIQRQACDLFQRLPRELAGFIDETVACAYNQGMADYATSGECGQYDTARLDMLKRYWRDETASYALVFVPEMLTRPSDFCNTYPTGAR